ncbi:hypothetical protein NPIL_436761, partial [Nephila pilipes]
FESYGIRVLHVFERKQTINERMEDLPRKTFCTPDLKSEMKEIKSD